MIQGSKLCLVKVCPHCTGSGLRIRKTGATQLNAGFGVPGESVPCAECVNGFFFEAVNEIFVVEALVGALDGDSRFIDAFDNFTKDRLREIRQRLLKIVTKASEENIVVGPPQ